MVLPINKRDGHGESKVANHLLYKGNEFCNYKSLACRTFSEMLSFNQQGANVNVDVSFKDHTMFWGTDSQAHWVPGTVPVHNYCQQWPQQNLLYQVNQSQSASEGTIPHQNYETSLNPQHQLSDCGLQTGAFQNWSQNRSIDHCSSYLETATINPADNFNQRTEALPQPNDISEAKFYSSPSTSRFSAMARSHHARITLVPTSNGSFKTIVKRKRKRTMFKTEQIETLEAVFAKKPYIGREDRQVLADQLQVSDNVVKVWFQNRRIREKKENEEAQSFSSISEESSSSSAHLDYLQSKINQNTDELGYVTLDDTAMKEIVNVIDIVLTDKIDLGLSQNNNIKTDCSDEAKPSISLLVYEPEDVSPKVPLERSSTEVEESTVDSDGSTYAGSIYEPISPALPENMDEEAPRWEPVTADKSLQRLFDLHFC